MALFMSHHVQGASPLLVYAWPDDILIDWALTSFLAISQLYHGGQFTYSCVSWFSYTSNPHNNLHKQLAAWLLWHIVLDHWWKTNDACRIDFLSIVGKKLGRAGIRTHNPWIDSPRARWYIGFVCFVGVLRHFQHYFSYITATVHLSWFLSTQISTRLENVPCPRALHYDRRAATMDRTRDANHSTTGDSWLICTQFYHLLFLMLNSFVFDIFH